MFSKVEKENQDRYDAIKRKINAESDSTEKQLTPPEVPDNDPVMLNPKKGKYSSKRDTTDWSLYT